MRVSLGRIGSGGARSPGWPVTVVAILAATACSVACRDGLAATFDEPDPTASVLLQSPAADPEAIGPAVEEGPAADQVGIRQDGSFPVASSSFLPASFTEFCNGGECGPADCDPPGLMQRLMARHGASGACWALRADALILWRDSPALLPLYSANSAVAFVRPTALDAADLESPAAGGGRLQALREDACGNGLEVGYLYGGRFFSEKVLPYEAGGYLTGPGGLDGVDLPNPIRALDQAGAQLLGSIQSGEINRRVGLFPSVRFLYGFRWFQWYETSLVADEFGAVDVPPIVGTDVYATSTVNNLWGGQIGFDALLLRTQHNFRIEGLVKAGAYANNASQTSRYTEIIEGLAPFQSQVTVNGAPASCSFAGEVGLTGVVPICDNWDFRFGYLGLWLTGLAQPTNQLSGQNLAQGVDPPTGTLNTSGTVIVQGVSLGLEGRW